MIRVTTQTRIQIASPDQGWSLTPGANHFESEMPESVAARFSKLQTDGVVTVDTLDTAGTATPWHSPSRLTP